MGRLLEWWTPATAARFATRARCIADQYSHYALPDGLHLNGNLTLGENIADNGGLKQAHSAFLRAGEQFDAQLIQQLFGLSPEQLFFVSYAQVWCEKAKEEILAYYVATNPHSPGEFRAIGPLSNFPPFAQAFQCPANSPMNPSEKCQVW